LALGPTAWNQGSKKSGGIGLGPHGRLDVAGGSDASDLVAAQADRAQDLYDADTSSDSRLPEDELEYCPGRRGGDELVADPLDLHLGTGETGEVACDFKAVALHGSSP
jgi:hypothetical protein